MVFLFVCVVLGIGLSPSGIAPAGATGRRTFVPLGAETAVGGAALEMYGPSTSCMFLNTVAIANARPTLSPSRYGVCYSVIYEVSEGESPQISELARRRFAAGTAGAA